MESGCSLNGEEYLWYKAPAKIHVALLRGTTADVDGNISLEKEAMLGDVLNQVQLFWGFDFGLKVTTCSLRSIIIKHLA